jgi:hypothetical protein
MSIVIKLFCVWGRYERLPCVLQPHRWSQIPHHISCIYDAPFSYVFLGRHYGRMIVHPCILCIVAAASCAAALWYSWLPHGDVRFWPR